ncbi:hypothetical protein XENOCAPTIV_006112 [Xenoophorus captivus]|uniref:Uncharacterized protein n=1 Tax=Xenoophorus captivus TaxID=1517983 RepID=A0ABV0R4F9_9TELE
MTSEFFLNHFPESIKKGSEIPESREFGNEEASLGITRAKVVLVVAVTGQSHCYLVPYMVNLETPVLLGCLDDQAPKVRQVSQEALDVQGLMEPKEKRENPVLEANQDHKVFLVPEGIPEFQGLPEQVLMGRGVEMAFQEFLDPKANLEKFWEPHLEVKDKMALLGYLETRASQAVQEHPDYPVFLDFQVTRPQPFLVHPDLLAAKDSSDHKVKQY